MADGLSSLIESKDWNGSSEPRCQCVDRVLAVLSLHVKDEGIPLLELALWKQNVKAPAIDESPFVPRSTKRRKVDRQACRVTNEASIVIPNVIGFLWDESATAPVDLPCPRPSFVG